jgi:hypothetical protein
MDRTELAAEVFVGTFTPALGDSYPRAVDAARTLAAIASVPLGKWTFDTDRPTDGAIARLVTELALMWERADLAAAASTTRATESCCCIAARNCYAAATPVAPSPRRSGPRTRPTDRHPKVLLRGNSFQHFRIGARFASHLFLEATPRQELPHGLLTC